VRKQGYLWTAIREKSTNLLYVKQGEGSSRPRVIYPVPIRSARDIVFCLSSLLAFVASRSLEIVRSETGWLPPTLPSVGRKAM
jgi:hypothetical protein